MNGLDSVRVRTVRWVGVFVAAALLAGAAGCYRASRVPQEEGKISAAPGGPSEAEGARAEGIAVPSEQPTEQREPSERAAEQAPAVPPEERAEEEIPPTESRPESPSPATAKPFPVEVPPPAVSFPEEEKTVPGEAETAAAAPAPSPSKGKTDGKEGAAGEPHATAGPAVPQPDAKRGSIVVARLSEEMTFPKDGPSWARGKEELVYKVEFLGITMGYARFSFLGKVLLSGKEAYHLRVRAWTSDILSLIYPIDDTIDYYLDVQTIAPLRQEFDRSRKEDDVAIYDQEKGTIVYRYKKDGKVRKKVDVVPNVYDPVSVAYYFRSRDLWSGEEGRPMYAGRKLWEISARPVGFERIRTDQGEVDTIIIQPVIRRGGKVEDKGDLRMWMSRDERHVPVRVYAKFKKIRMWTLVGQLVPDLQGG